MTFPLANEISRVNDYTILNAKTKTEILKVLQRFIMFAKVSFLKSSDTAFRSEHKFDTKLTNRKVNGNIRPCFFANANFLPTE